MKQPLALLALLPLCLLASDRAALAHCEVPCGIYDDAARFDAMLEDTTTIAKAMTQIAALAGRTEHAPLNQLVRWVTTKEAHATRVMETIAQYFMAQRIEPPSEDGGDEAAARYVALLTRAHAVLRAAMLCKRTTAGGAAEALRAAIVEFRTLYEGS